MSAGGQDKAAYRAAGPGKMGFKKGAYGSAKGVRAKAANLSDAQLKRAGALKASKKAAIDYTKTSRVLGSGVTRGPGGKLLTGKVTLANGKTAVYKAGKRVINVKPSSGDGGGGGGNGTWKGRGLSKSAVSKAMEMHAKDLRKTKSSYTPTRNTTVTSGVKEGTASGSTASTSGTASPTRVYPSMNVGRGASTPPVSGTRGKIIALQNKISSLKATAKQNQENAKTAAAKAAAAAKDNATLRALQQQLSTMSRG
jgi:hypothetical protein